VTIGSDAHVSENIGRAFDEVTAMLKRMGFRNYYYYKNRRGIQCTL